MVELLTKTPHEINGLPLSIEPALTGHLRRVKRQYYEFLF